MEPEIPPPSVAPAAPGAVYPERRWVAMAVLLGAAFMNLIDISIVNVALPSMMRAFRASPAAIEWVVAAFILTVALGLLPAGRLGDMLGRRRMFVTGVAVFTLGSALCGLAPTIGALVAARVVQAAGGAMMTPQTLALVPALFPPEERGTAFALFGLSSGLAAVMGPVLGGVLIGQDIFGLDWRPIFLVNLPVGALAIVLALRLVPEVKGGHPLRVDLAGIALAAAALLAVVFPLIEGREAGWPAWCFALLAAALPLAIGFGLWEARQARRGGAQLFPISLLSDRGFVLGTLLAALQSSGIPGFFVVFAVFLQSGFGLDPLQSGLTSLPFSVGVMAASITSGRLGGRWQRQRITAGAGALALAMIWLRLVVGGMGETVIWADLAPAMFLGGFGLGTSISPIFQVVLATVPARDTGSASGALQAFQQVGGALGVAILGEIFFTGLAGLGAGAAADHALYRQAFASALLYNSIAFFAIAVLIWAVRRPAEAGDFSAKNRR